MVNQENQESIRTLSYVEKGGVLAWGISRKDHMLHSHKGIDKELRSVERKHVLVQGCLVSSSLMTG